jgi:hypothetical protein
MVGPLLRYVLANVKQIMGAAKSRYVPFALTAIITTEWLDLGLNMSYAYTCKHKQAYILCMKYCLEANN